MSGTLFTTRNRSFSQVSIRRKILRSASQHESQKDLMKSATMTSFRPKLERLIKQGKIEQIINSDKHSKANLFYASHVNDMQKQLADSKKALSMMALKAKSKQFSINKMKNEIIRLQREIQAIKANNQAINKIYDNTVLNLDQKKQSRSNIEWTEKNFTHLKQRCIKDEYYYKVHYETIHKNLEAQSQRGQFLQKKHHQIEAHYRQLQHAIHQAKSISSQETFLKNQFIDLINQDRQEKEFLHDLRVDKQKRQASINQLSSWVIQKQELNKYLSIMYTHRILSGIVRTKNSCLLKKYSQVQSAYMHIKSNTNIIQFDKIIKKMQEQDSIYDITVKKVSDLQTQLQAMQKNIQKAKKQRHKILSQEGKSLQLEKDYYKGIEKDRYELLLSDRQKLQHRITQDDILRQRVVQWGNRAHYRLKIFKNGGETFQDILNQCVQRMKSRQIKANNIN